MKRSGGFKLISYIRNHRGPNPIGKANNVPKWLLITVGWLAVGLAALGAVLPLLPTTPFLLVATWAFARSSPRFRDWLINHAVFGPLIRDWQEYGAIPLRAKLLAALMITASAVWLIFWSGLPLVATVALSILLFAVASFILTRPTPGKEPVP